eukprot:CAMPEP_0118698552 /NCGR_PEP_ID=MMETSP0800-20121206/15277_1 /TAXON_ID=210618 ORGANISM="Striatella unipunctata, Strain CCMP2910" /NCGR_SAMPLE_ID=MMETSP0800 /ASSEMBLY_ACC=CAM_ASM_000638 /LENGTH=571 /DNA_ID=CAMNT_0006598411 /DNA_START=313 /DNA_END=2028 /DNA_ORIENTATION=-
MSFMNFLARVTFWASLLFMSIGVVWYSRELFTNGTKPHLIAWFSAGAFVLLGFPISIYGILMHLTNYYQPNVQCYVVRILWMVPLYSIESWLCLRYRTYAIYIETARDCYESYVLYCFFEYLIQVLGGQEELVLILKDKSPTRGVHMSPLHWFLRPWLMGQPVSRKVVYGGNGREEYEESDRHAAANRPTVQVHWSSPFFVNCKAGVLQYVVLKGFSAIAVMILELNNLYKEGDFTPKGGYLYICILTNTSQCWALYCLLFFYHATKSELGPVRPVGKFLCVKSLVFFTWWQGLAISLLYEMDMIPHYAEQEWSSADVAKCLQDYLICIEMFLIAIAHTFVFPHTDYLNGSFRGISSRAHPVSGKRLGRKYRRNFGHKYTGLNTSSTYNQDVEAGEADAENALLIDGIEDQNAADLTPHDSDDNGSAVEGSAGDRRSDDQTKALHFRSNSFEKRNSIGVSQTESVESDQKGKSPSDDAKPSSKKSPPLETKQSPDQDKVSPPNSGRQRQGFVRALLDSTIPLDVMDSTVGMVKGDFVVEKKTLLHHAATSDQYDLFSSRRYQKKKTEKEQL